GPMAPPRRPKEPSMQQLANPKYLAQSESNTQKPLPKPNLTHQRSDKANTIKPQDTAPKRHDPHPTQPNPRSRRSVHAPRQRGNPQVRVISQRTYRSPRSSALPLAA